MQASVAMAIVVTASVRMRECGSSGEDVSVNAVIIPRNWGQYLPRGKTPSKGIAAQFC